MNYTLSLPDAAAFGVSRRMHAKGRASCGMVASVVLCAIMGAETREPRFSPPSFC
jgi:hypothetical protein